MPTPEAVSHGFYRLIFILLMLAYLAAAIGVGGYNVIFMITAYSLGTLPDLAEGFAAGLLATIVLFAGFSLSKEMIARPTGWKLGISLVPAALVFVLLLVKAT